MSTSSHENSSCWRQESIDVDVFQKLRLEGDSRFGTMSGKGAIYFSPSWVKLRITSIAHTHANGMSFVSTCLSNMFKNSQNIVPANNSNRCKYRKGLFPQQNGLQAWTMGVPTVSFRLRTMEIYALFSEWPAFALRPASCVKFAGSRGWRTKQ